MSKSLFFLICSPLLLLFSACSITTEHKLNKVEKMMQDNPKPALEILQELYEDYEAMSDKHKAQFGMFYSQALNKNDLALTSVALIDFSISYFLQYKSKRNDWFLAYSYLYKARLRHENNKYAEASSLLLKSLDLAKQLKDNYLLARVYSDLGRLYVLQDEFEQAIQNYYLAIESIKILKDDKNNYYSHLLIDLGYAYNLSGDNKKALECFYNALTESSDSLLTGSFLLSIGQNYYSNMEFDSALYYVKKSATYPYYGISMSTRYYYLSDIYFNLAQYDSAKINAFRAFDFITDYGIQRECFRVLVNTAYVENAHSDTLLYYMRQYQLYDDSVLMLEMQPKVAQVEALHYAENKKTEYEQMVQNNEKCRILCFLVVLLMLVCMVLVYRYMRKKCKSNVSLCLYMQSKSTTSRDMLINDLCVAKNAYADELDGAKDESSKNKLQLMIYNNILYIKNEDAFLSKMNEALNQLPAYLQHTFSWISYKEIVFCCAYVLGLPNDDVAVLLNCKSISLYKKKQRLAKKMNMKSTKELDAFLDNSQKI